MEKNDKYYSVIVLDMVIGVPNPYPYPNPNRIIYNIKVLYNIYVCVCVYIYMYVCVYSLCTESYFENTKITLCELYFVAKFKSFDMNQNL